ncbi:MAG: hypothetical protein ACRD3Q_18020 [Terriglobales bacterium]
MTWIRLLTKESDLVGSDYPHLALAEPPTFSLPVGLDDQAWLTLSEAKSDEDDPAAEDETQIGLDLQ